MSPQWTMSDDRFKDPTWASQAFPALPVLTPEQPEEGDMSERFYKRGHEHILSQWRQWPRPNKEKIPKVNTVYLSLPLLQETFSLIQPLVPKGSPNTHHDFLGFGLCRNDFQFSWQISLKQNWKEHWFCLIINNNVGQTVSSKISISIAGTFSTLGLSHFFLSGVGSSLHSTKNWWTEASQ